MALLNRILGPATAVAMLAGTAHAQFVVENNNGATVSHKLAARSSGTSTDKQTIVISHDDGSTYKVVIENGEVTGAWANGKRLEDSRIKHDEHVVNILGDDGKILQTFKVGTAKAPQLPRAPQVEFFSSDRFPGNVEVKVTADEFKAPPVMLGINLSEPSDAMRAQLGLGDTDAILVDGVVDGLPAQKAGIKKYDLIVSLDGSDGASSESLSKVMSEKAAGDEMKIVVLRGGEKIKLVAELAAYDAEALGQMPAILYDDDPRFPGWAEQDGQGQTRLWVDRNDGVARVRPQGEARIESEAAREAAERAQRSVEAMQRKIESAMREAERRVLELRDGQLFFSERDEAGRALDEHRLLKHLGELESRFDQHMPGLQSELDTRLDAMERRFDAVEAQLNERLEGLGGRMERLADLLERLAERLERVTDEDED